MLLKASVQQIDLRCERIFRCIPVKVLEIFVVGEWLVVDIDVEVVGEGGGEGGFPGADEAGDADEEVFEARHSEDLFNFLSGFLGDVRRGSGGAFDEEIDEANQAAAAGDNRCNHPK